MKELIVVVGMTVLGCIIFNLIAGDGPSLRTAGIEKMEKISQMYEEMK